MSKHSIEKHYFKILFFLVAMFLISVNRDVLSGPPIIFKGDSAALLTPNLEFSTGVKLLSGTVDPSSSAVSAPIGSLYLNTSTGVIYHKTDNGSSTNWDRVSFPSATETLIGKSIDADDNTITDIDNNEIKASAAIALNKLAATTANRALISDASGFVSASSVSNTTLGYLDATSSVQTQLDSKASNTALDSHLNDTTDAHAGSAITNTPSGNLAASTVQGALDELQTDVDTRATSTALSDHISDSADAHAASAIGNTASGNLAATTVQGALNELQTDVDTRATSTALSDHIGDTTDAHAASAITNTPSGNLAATTVQAALNELQGDIDSTITATSTSTLSNKTLVAPIIDDSGVFNHETSVSAPASGKLAVYAKADDRLYALSNSGIEELIGPNGPPVTEYIRNGTAEKDTTGWSTFKASAASVPSACSGGSPSVTWTRTTSSPLSNTGSFLLTKGASNLQGEGVAYTFSPDRADYAAGNVLQVSAEVEISGTYTTGDIAIYAFDNTNNVAIQPSGHQVEYTTIPQPKNNVEFQIPTTSTSMSICIYVSSTSSSSYTAKFDNISVKRVHRSYGPVVTDWISYTPQISWVSNASAVAKYKKVGDQIQVSGVVSVTGAPTAATLAVYLPSGLTFDSSKMSSADGNDFTLGFVNVLDASAGVGGTGSVAVNGTNQVYFKTHSASIPQATINATSPVTFASGDKVYFHFSGPISGWGGVQEISSATDTKVISARYYTSATQTTTNGNRVDYTTLAHDDVNAKSGSGNTWAWTTTVPGKYEIYAQNTTNTISATVGHQFRVDIYANGSKVAQGVKDESTNTTARKYTSHARTDVNLQAGQTIYIQMVADSSFSSATLSGTAEENFITIKRTAGPTQVAASSTVVARYTSNANQSFANGTITIIDFEDKSEDQFSAVSTGPSWKFQAPTPGFYCAIGTIQFATDADWSVGETAFIYTYKNGTIYDENFDKLYATTGSAPTFKMDINTCVRMNQGDYIDFRAAQNSGGTVVLDAGSGAMNKINIYRAGN